MNILAIDTTTKRANVTLDINEKIASKSVDNEITHSEKLLPLIDECLKQAHSRISEIDTFCVTTGPGSFTGIRIGIATIKAFAKLSNSKIFAANSLEVIAYESVTRDLKSDYVLSMLDAKNNRVYYSLYRVDNNLLIPVVSPLNDNISDAINVVNEYISCLNTSSNISITVIGDTIDVYKQNISDALFANIQPNFIDTNISSIVLLSMAKDYMSNGTIDNTKYIYNYANLDATYIRPSQAERIKNGEQH